MFVSKQATIIFLMALCIASTSGYEHDNAEEDLDPAERWRRFKEAQAAKAADPQKEPEEHDQTVQATAAEETAPAEAADSEETKPAEAADAEEELDPAERWRRHKEAEAAKAANPQEKQKENDQTVQAEETKPAEAADAEETKPAEAADAEEDPAEKWRRHKEAEAAKAADTKPEVNQHTAVAQETKPAEAADPQEKPEEKPSEAVEETKPAEAADAEEELDPAERWRRHKEAEAAKAAATKPEESQQTAQDPAEQWRQHVAKQADEVKAVEAADPHGKRFETPEVKEIEKFESSNRYNMVRAMTAVVKPENLPLKSTDLQWLISIVGCVTIFAVIYTRLCRNRRNFDEVIYQELNTVEIPGLGNPVHRSRMTAAEKEVFSLLDLPIDDDYDRTRLSLSSDDYDFTPLE